MNLQNKNHGRFCRTDGRTDGHFKDLAQLKLRKVEMVVASIKLNTDI